MKMIIRKIEKIIKLLLLLLLLLLMIRLKKKFIKIKINNKKSNKK